ncbi:MAG: hypothetical protein ABEI99_00430 [Halobaculum sp.]
MRAHLEEPLVRRGALLAFVLAIAFRLTIQFGITGPWPFRLSGLLAGLYVGAMVSKHGDPLRLGLLIGVYGGTAYAIVQILRTIPNNPLNEIVLGIAGAFWGVAVLVTGGIPGVYLGKMFLSERFGSEPSAE